MKRMLLGITAATMLVFVATFGVMAQGGLPGLAQPIVINIDQAVPVDVTMALPLDDGTIVTTTAPITVTVVLQVKLEGKNVVSVTPLEADAPTISTDQAEPAEAENAGGELVDLSGIPYTVETDGNITITQVRSKDMMGSMTQLVGELTNDGDAEVKYLSMTVKFYDADGNLLDLGMGSATSSEIAPGESTAFQAMATVAYDKVASYTIEVK